jgi:hypothetical protein
MHSALKNSLIIHEENTKKNHKRVVSVYVIQIHVDLHKLYEFESLNDESFFKQFTTFASVL